MHMIPCYRWIMLARDFDGLIMRYMDMKVDIMDEGIGIYFVQEMNIHYRMNTLLPHSVISTEEGTCLLPASTE